MDFLTKHFWRFLLATLLLPCLPLTGEAEPIYQWKDGEGRIHYGSAAPDDATTPVELPEIKREDFDSKIADIKASTPTTCNAHRGIDCAKGPDQDGSVICADGFLDAINPFAFSCSESRIQTNFLILVKDGKEFVQHSRSLQSKLKGHKISGYQITARNVSDVEAFGVKVSLTMPGRAKQIVPGPEKIAPFTSAEYLLPFSTDSDRPSIYQVERTNYSINCTNCGAVKKGSQ